MRTTRLRRLLLDVAACSGLGSAGAIIAYALLTAGRQNIDSISTQPVSEFSAWADDLWQVCKHHYSMVAVRDAHILNILYPADNPRFIRLKVLEGNGVAGWAAVLGTLMSGDRYFGTCGWVQLWTAWPHPVT